MKPYIVFFYSDCGIMAMVKYLIHVRGVYDNHKSMAIRCLCFGGLNATPNVSPFMAIGCATWLGQTEWLSGLRSKAVSNGL